MYDIVDVGEIPALCPVAIYRRPFAIGHQLDELGDGRRVSGLGVLAGTKNIEESQRDCFQAVTVIEGPGIELAGQFGGGVRRDRRRGHPLGF